MSFLQVKVQTSLQHSRLANGAFYHRVVLYRCCWLQHLLVWRTVMDFSKMSYEIFL